LSPSPSSSSSS